MEQDFVRFQAEHHPLVQTSEFDSIEEYCLHLIHLKAYEKATALGCGKIVLDLGCNNGYGTGVIAASARRVVGVDVSETAIAEARRQQRGQNISFVGIDGDRLPFDDKEFDVICSFQVIEHVSDYQPYLSEIIRVLKDDGIVIFTTPNARIRLDPNMKPWFPFHIREFSGSELRDLLQQWFARVEVTGLFATKELYQVERARVQRSREMARRRAKALFPPYREIRTKGIISVKAVLPARFVKAIQGLLRQQTVRQEGAEKIKPVGRPATDPALLSRFSTQNLFYLDAEFDEALDLMAVCQKMEMS